MKNTRLWILLAGIAVLLLTFLLLNFHAAVSNTQAQNNITTTSIGDQLPDAMQRKDRISIVVIGESPLVGMLQIALPEAMHSAGIEDFEMVQSQELTYPNPALIIKVEKPSLFWTPFFAASQFSVQAGYASSGNATFMGETPGIMNNKNGPSLNIYAEYQLTDRSWGLISRLGYHRILADYLAQQIVAAIRNVYYLPGLSGKLW